MVIRMVTSSYKIETSRESLKENQFILLVNLGNKTDDSWMQVAPKGIRIWKDISVKTDWCYKNTYDLHVLVVH